MDDNLTPMQWTALALATDEIAKIARAVRSNYKRNFNPDIVTKTNIQRMRNAGMSPLEISRAMGLSYATVIECIDKMIKGGSTVLIEKRRKGKHGGARSKGKTCD